jgi:Predicted integral membrane protein
MTLTIFFEMTFFVDTPLPPVDDFINKYFVALAIPLLLYDSNIRRVLSDTGSLLVAFLIGAVSTVIGTIITYPLFPLKSLGSEGWKIASALAARHIGGAINFVAVCETLNVSGSAISASIAADNVVVALYFALLFSLATDGEDSSIAKSSRGPQDESNLDVEIRDPENVSNTGGNITMPSIAVSLTVASCLVTVGKIMTRVFFPSTSSLPLISIVTVIAASLFPNFFQSISFTGTSIGVIFMQMFFAASGAAGSIRLVMKKAPSLFLFSLLQVAIHFISLIGIGRVVLKMNSNELYLASNANVGGPTTAAAMAQAKEWKRLVLPALLIGILGYATATPIALGLGQLLKKMPIFGS